MKKTRPKRSAQKSSRKRKPMANAGTPAQPKKKDEFDGYAWHDCSIWGIEFRKGEAEEGDWTSEIVFSIDYIVQWLCGVKGDAQFQVAPASLVFRGVTDPKISIDWGNTQHRHLMHGVYVDHIEREACLEPEGPVGRPHYKWKIVLNWPDDSEITFGASGFTQTLLSEPIVLTMRQHLTMKERNKLLGR